MIPRLFVSDTLLSGGVHPLTEEQAHYLRNVLRRDTGAELRLFNARDGEFAAKLEVQGKKKASARIQERMKAPQVEPDIGLIFAPVKRAPVETLIQKCTELGVAYFQPVTTARTNSERLRIDRLETIALEAAEQCERLSVPPVHDVFPLEELLAAWDRERRLIFCDEAGDDADAKWGGDKGRAGPFLDVMRSIPWVTPSAVLIGPEGGFSPEERARLRESAFVSPVSLGPHILRADTAAIVAIALWQAAHGNLQRN